MIKEFCSQLSLQKLASEGISRYITLSSFFSWDQGRVRQSEGKFKAAKKRTFWCWIKEFWSNLFEMARSVIMMKVESKVWFCPGIPRGYSLSASPEDLKIFFFYFLESKATALRYTPGTNHLPLKGLLSWLNCVDQVNHQKSIIVLCGCIRRNELIIIVWD